MLDYYIKLLLNIMNRHQFVCFYEARLQTDTC